MIKIIAGTHKGRVIPTLKNAKYRPSTSKFREAVFSILTSGEFGAQNILPGANILDLYCGTGSLAFEALSRGAKSATLVDINVDYLKAAKEFAAKIGEEENSKFLNFNATQLPKAVSTYGIVFMDPPYNYNLAVKTIRSLIRNSWLQKGAIIIAELAKTEEIDQIEEIDCIDKRIYGNNKLLILQYSSE